MSTLSLQRTPDLTGQERQNDFFSLFISLSLRMLCCPSFLSSLSCHRQGLRRASFPLLGCVFAALVVALTIIHDCLHPPSSSMAACLSPLFLWLETERERCLTRRFLLSDARLLDGSSGGVGKAFAKIERRRQREREDGMVTMMK